MNAKKRHVHKDYKVAFIFHNLCCKYGLFQTISSEAKIQKLRRSKDFKLGEWATAFLVSLPSWTLFFVDHHIPDTFYSKLPPYSRHVISYLLINHPHLPDIFLPPDII